jgi:hypothetical protein
MQSTENNQHSSAKGPIRKGAKQSKSFQMRRLERPNVAAVAALGVGRARIVNRPRLAALVGGETAAAAGINGRAAGQQRVGQSRPTVVRQRTEQRVLVVDVVRGDADDGTAIGMGLANAVSRIKDSKAISKVIILLTDGVNNQGNVAPETAAEIAKAFGVRVYTIGVGTTGMAYSPVGMYPNGEYAYDYAEVKIDEEGLKKIAKMTDGKYFRATSNNKLKNIYKEIDKLEKSKIEVTEYRKRKEEFFWFAVAAGILLVLEFILRTIVLRTTP